MDSALVHWAANRLARTADWPRERTYDNLYWMQANFQRETPAPETERALQLFGDVLRLSKRELAARGVTFRVVLLPEPSYFRPEYRAALAAHFGFAVEDLKPELFRARVDQACVAAGVPFLDLWDTVKQGYDADPSFCASTTEGPHADHHYGARGHRVVAEALAAWLPTLDAVPAHP